MRHKPSIGYNGLTVVLSNPSRMDTRELISGTAGHFFQEECLGIHVSRKMLDIRTSDTLKDGLLEGTKGLLLLGDRAFHEWTLPGKYKDYSLSEQRGNPLENPWNLPCIASYFPQDATDIRDWEQKLNPLDKYEQEDEEGQEQEDDESENEYDSKKKGKTKRGNYRFWLKADTQKICKSLLENKPYTFPTTGDSKLDRVLAPSSSTIINFLRNTINENLYLDIETTVDGGYNMLCIGIATDTSPVYVIPVFRYNHTHHYSDIALIFAAITLAMLRNTVITHNGYGFDLLILAWRYHLAWGRNHYDTMVAFHRCFPEVEKSLGHCISYFLWEAYHKDEGCFNPHNGDDDRRLWEYNALDVHRMRQLKWAIDAYAKRIPGLPESIAQGMETIYPYTLCSLAGIGFKDELRQAIIHENDRLMMQYLRLIDIAKGDNYKERLLPTSPKSCVNFFHNYLNYKVVSRSQRISKVTNKPVNNPSLNEKALYKLKLVYPQNVIIDLCIAYRRKQKETSMLRFNPWNISELPC